MYTFYVIKKEKGGYAAVDAASGGYPYFSSFFNCYKFTDKEEAEHMLQKMQRENYPGHYRIMKVVSTISPV